MPQITALEPQRRKGRLNVFVDGQFVIGVGETVAADLGLRVGREITPERLREIAGAEEVHKATEAALVLLEVRARARREIETRLAQKGYDEECHRAGDGKADPAWNCSTTPSLPRSGWRPKRASAAAGPSASGGCRQELFGKGVAKDQIAEAVERVSEDDELALARAAARKKVRVVPTDREALQAERRKLMGFLQRRGFGWETVKRVTREALPAPGERRRGRIWRGRR